MTPGEASTARLPDDARRICAVPAPPFAEDARCRFVAGLFGEDGLELSR